MGDKYIINDEGKCVGRITDTNPDYNEKPGEPLGVASTLIFMIAGALVVFIPVLFFSALLGNTFGPILMIVYFVGAIALIVKVVSEVKK